MASKKIKLLKIADLKKPDSRKALKEVTLIPRIEALLEDMNQEPISMKGELEIGDKERRTQVFSASEVGMKNGRSLCGKYVMGCGRYLYYAYTGARGEKSFEPKFRRILDSGSALHVQLQLYILEAAKKQSFKAEVEVDGNPHDNEWSLSAHMDAGIEIVTPEIAVRFGVELKTIGDDGFKVTTKIQDHHATQCTIYQRLFDLPAVLVLYYNKNNSLMAEFLQIWDQRRWEAIETKLNHVREQSLIGEPPAHEVSYECNNCKYKTICDPPRRASVASTRKLFLARPKTVAGKEED